MIDLIKYSFDKFKPDLKGKRLLTEAASGNYKCTAILGAMAGADVYAIGKDSRYGRYSDVVKETTDAAKVLGVSDRIQFSNRLDEIPLHKMDVVTNTGFVRPINKNFIDQLKGECVIPLIYEPWELRESDIDVQYCSERGINVFGTNESDSRLRTMNYIGFTVLHLLLQEKKTPFTSKILLIGSEKFNLAIANILNALDYDVDFCSTSHFDSSLNGSSYDVIVCTEMTSEVLIIGPEGALIHEKEIREDSILIHIAGNIELNRAGVKLYPEKNAEPGYMSYTTDFIDPVAVTDLHCAALKVAEGMILANSMNLSKNEYKEFLEKNYPALAIP